MTFSVGSKMKLVTGEMVEICSIYDNGNSYLIRYLDMPLFYCKMKIVSRNNLATHLKPSTSVDI